MTARGFYWADRKAYLRQYHLDHPRDKDSDRDLRYQRRYGITLIDYNRMLKEQVGVCAICGHPPKKNRLSVDHDHKTGQVRGLLCVRCNRALPRFNDSADLLERAAAYINAAKAV